MGLCIEYSREKWACVSNTRVKVSLKRVRPTGTTKTTKVRTGRSQSSSEGQALELGSGGLQNLSSTESRLSFGLTRGDSTSCLTHQDHVQRAVDRAQRIAALDVHIRCHPVSNHLERLPGTLAAAAVVVHRKRNALPAQLATLLRNGLVYRILA